MLEKLKQSWRDFQDDTPGERFQDYYKRRQRSHQSIWWKALFIGSGLLIMAIGLFFMVAPGPGVIVIFLGAALIAQQSLLAARALDWLEVQSRKLAAWSLGAWRRAPMGIKIVLVLSAIVLAGALAVGAYVLLFAK